MSVCDICEIADYPGGCNEAPELEYQIWAACEYEMERDYIAFLKGRQGLPPHKR